MQTEATLSIAGEHGTALGAVKSGRGEANKIKDKSGDKGQNNGKPGKGGKQDGKGASRREQSTDSAAGAGGHTEVCRKHLLGKCPLFAEQCPRWHNKPCLFFRKPGGCKNGRDLNFPHVQATPAAAATRSASESDDETQKGQKDKS